jgi:hypothetical protein
MPLLDEDSPISANTIRLIITSALFFVAAFVVIPFILECMGFTVSRCLNDTVPCGLSSTTSIQLRDQ